MKTVSILHFFVHPAKGALNIMENSIITGRRRTSLGIFIVERYSILSIYFDKFMGVHFWMVFV